MIYLFTVGVLVSLVSSYITLRMAASIESVRDLYKGVIDLGIAVGQDVGDIHARLAELEAKTASMPTVVKFNTEIN